MNRFLKGLLVVGLVCVLSGGALATVLAFGYQEEIVENFDDLRVEGGSFWGLLEGVRRNDFGIWGASSITLNGKRYTIGDATERYDSRLPEEAAVTEIVLSFAAGEIRIAPGDCFSVEAEGILEDTITAEYADGVWSVEDALLGQGDRVRVLGNYCPKIRITLPEGVGFDSVRITAAAGWVTVEELSTKRLELSLAAGEMSVRRLRVERQGSINVGAGSLTVASFDGRNISIDNGVGQTSVSGSMTGSCRIDCGIGEVELLLSGRDSLDFSYSVDCGIGEVDIDGARLYGGAKRTVSESGDHFEIDCGIGRVVIRTGK